MLVWRQSCPIAICSVAPECSATASPYVGSGVCLLAAASGSSHGVTWVAGMCLAKAAGRVDVYTQGQQGSDCENNARSLVASRMWALQASPRSPLRHHVSAAAFDYQPQQAAARNAIPWVSRPCEGEGVSAGGGVWMGGRLHPGLAGERLPKQRPKLCICLYGRPRRGSWRQTGRRRCSFLDPGFETE